MGFTKQASYYTVGNVVTLFAQWLIIMLIPKITDFAEAGLFAVAVSVASIMNQVATFTLNQHQVADAHVRFSRNDYAVTRLVTIALSFVLIFPVALIFGYGYEEIVAIVIYTVYRNLLNYAYLHMSEMQLLGHLDYAGKCMVVEGAVSLVVFMVPYFVTGNLFLAMGLMALAGGGLFLVMMSWGYRQYSGEPYGLDIHDTSHVKALFMIGVPLLASTLSPIIITALPKLILENQWGKEAVGYFSTLTSPTILVPTLAVSLFTPLIGYFADICRNGDRRRLNLQYSKMLVLLAGMAVVFYVLSVLLAGPVFEAVYGEEIVPYVGYFNVLIVGIFLYSAGILGTTVLITKDQGRYGGLSAVVSLVAAAAILVWWIPSGGMEAATWGLFASYGIFGILISLCVYIIPLDTSK